MSENATSYRNYLNYGDKELKTPEHDLIMLWLNKECKNVAIEVFPEVKDAKFKSPEWERPYTGKTNSILCFIDLALDLEYSEIDRERQFNRTWSVLFEVKPKIFSIGETIRQIQAYKHHVRGSNTSMYDYSEKKFVIVSPDDRFKEIFKEQKIYFYKSPDLIP